MKTMLILLIACASATAQAEVFKCTGPSGRTVYQSDPCESAAKARQLDIKADPAKEAEAKAKFEALETEFDAKKAARLQAEKEEAAQRNQAEQTEALKRSAAAQQQRAIAEQRQAEALERQNQLNNLPMFIMPPFVTPFPSEPPVRREPPERPVMHDWGRKNREPESRDGDGR